MGLKENLKKRRLELNLTLSDVAKQLSVSKPTMQRYESGVISNIPSDKIEKLANILNTTPEKLMGWTDDEINDDQITLTKEELNLLRKYHSLDTIGKHTVNTVLDCEYKRCK